MASSSHTAAPVNPSRRPSHRLFFVLAAAVVLVTLPVLPLHFMGVSAPNLAAITPDLSQLSKFGHELLGKINDSLVVAPGRPAQTTESDKGAAMAGGADVQVMDSAARQLTAAIEKSPMEPSLHNQLGLLYAGLGDYNKSVVQFEKAVELARLKLTALVNQEQQLRSQGKLDEASNALLERSKINVELSAAHSSLARVFDQLGQHDRVVTQLEQLNRDINFGSALTAKAPRKTDGKSVKVTATTRKLTPQILQYLARAEAFMQARRFPEAVQEYRHVILIDPLVVVAHQKLGIASEMVGNYGMAVQALETAVRLDPLDARSRQYLAVAYQALNELPKAKAQYEQAMKLTPTDPEQMHAVGESAYNLGNICAQSGEMDEAVECFKVAVKLNPHAPMAHNNLGSMLSLNGKYQEAIGEFQQALSLAPDLASSHYGLGLALFNCKDYTSSIREFKRALALNPSLVDAHNKIDQAYRKAGLAANSGFRVN